MADFNGDGNLDLAVANANSGTVRFSWATAVAGSELPRRSLQAMEAHRTGTGTVAGDFNGDGKTDLAVVNSGTGTVGILLGNGNGGVRQRTSVFSSGGGWPQGAVVGDFNGDGNARSGRGKP